MEPLVSVIVISYNSERHIEATLNSILAQTYKRIELIIADDCSEDGTIAIIENWLNKNYFRFENAFLMRSSLNRGTTSNCNQAVGASSGEFFKIFAADDLMKCDYLADMVKALIQNKADLAFCYEYIFTQEQETLLYTKKEKQLNVRPWRVKWFSLSNEQMYHKLLITNFFPAPTAIIRRELYDRLCGFNSRYKLIEDYPFWLKAIRFGAKVTFVKKKNVYYRKTANSISLRDTKKSTTLQVEFRKCLDLVINEIRNPELIRLGFPVSKVIMPDADIFSKNLQESSAAKKSRCAKFVIQLNDKLTRHKVPKILRVWFFLLSPTLCFEKCCTHSNRFKGLMEKAKSKITTWDNKIIALNDRLTRKKTNKVLRFFVILLSPRIFYNKVKRFLYVKRLRFVNLARWKTAVFFRKFKKKLYDADNNVIQKLGLLLYKFYDYKHAYIMNGEPESNKHWLQMCLHSLYLETRYLFHHKKDKTKVVFAVHMLFSFSALESIYLAMAESDDFQPMIMLLPTIQVGMDKEMYYGDGLVESMKAKGYPFIFAYEHSKWKNILELDPDLVFYQTPYYIQRHPIYNSKCTISYPKIAYTPYGPWVMDKSVKEYIDCGIDKAYFNNLWRFFADKLTMELLEYASPEYMSITVQTGSPKVDFIKTKITNGSYCWKRPHDVFKKRIIWLPRWGIEQDRTSFLDYYEYFIGLILAKTDIDFVMRPHPFLFKEIIRSKKFTENELNDIINAFEQPKNSCIDYNCDYREGIISCDFIVADFTSIIYEYLPSGKPIIYTKKDNTLIDSRIMDACYIVNDLNELRSNIDMLLSGKDELKEKRMRLISEIEYFPHNMENNGKRIVEYIRENI